MPPDLTKILTANRSSAGREALHLGALLLKRGVNVEGKRGGDVGVPEDLRERLGIKALLNAARREGVAQIVEADALTARTAKDPSEDIARSRGVSRRVGILR